MTKGRWNVLVYMVADDAFGVFTNDNVDLVMKDMEPLAKQHPHTRFAIRADTHGSTGFVAVAEDGRFQMHKLERDPVAGEHDIEKFLDGQISRDASDKNLVLFWGHGFGPAGLHYERQFLDPIRLSRAIRGKTGDRCIDLLVLMSCHMSTIELMC